MDGLSEVRCKALKSGGCKNAAMSYIVMGVFVRLLSRLSSLYSKFSFGEVYRRCYGWKSSFTVTRQPKIPTIYLPKRNL